MKKLSVFAALFAACILLAGCAPKIDASSEAKFKQSMSEVGKELSPEKSREFGAACLVVLLSQKKVKKGEELKILHGKTADDVIAMAKKIRAKKAAAKK